MMLPGLALVFAITAAADPASTLPPDLPPHEELPDVQRRVFALEQQHPPVRADPRIREPRRVFGWEWRFEPVSSYREVVQREVQSSRSRVVLTKRWPSPVRVEPAYGPAQQVLVFDSDEEEEEGRVRLCFDSKRVAFDLSSGFISEAALETLVGANPRFIPRPRRLLVQIDHRPTRCRRVRLQRAPPA